MRFINKADHYRLLEAERKRTAKAEERATAWKLAAEACEPIVEDTFDEEMAHAVALAHIADARKLESDG